VDSLVRESFLLLDYYGPMTPSQRSKLLSLLLSFTLSAPTAWAQSSPQANSALSGSMLYEILLAEISAYNGDASSAYQLMLNAAQKYRADQLFERAVEIALQARSGESALQAAQSWAHASPTSKDANHYLLQILIGLNRLQDTVGPIRRELTSRQPEQRAAAIDQIPRYFVRAADKALAAKVIEQALAPELTLASTGPAAYAAIGTMRSLAKDSEGALEAAEKGTALNSKADEPVQLALALMDPKLPGAEVLVVNHLANHPHPEIHLTYIRKLLDTQRYADAYTQSLKLNAAAPDFADGWLVRGSLALQRKDLSEAQSALGTFVKLRQASKSADSPGAADDRGLTQAYFLLSDIAERNHQPDQAQHYLALIDSPQDAIRVHARRAAILAREGKLEQARTLIRETPENQPDDARAKLSAEVQLLRDNKQFQLAYDVLQEAVQHDPADIDLRYDLAMAAEKLDKMAEMETLLRQVVAEKPDYHNAYNALGYSLADRNTRLPEARELIQKALKFAPDDPFIQDSLGWVEFRSGNLAQALQILQTAYQKRHDPEIAAHLGEVLWALNQQEQARAIWSEGLTQKPDNDTLLQTIKRLSPP
jgi:tetratricopeptide (TPR) repeat protein